MNRVGSRRSPVLALVVIALATLSLAGASLFLLPISVAFVVATVFIVAIGATAAWAVIREARHGRD